MAGDLRVGHPLSGRWRVTHIYRKGLVGNALGCDPTGPPVYELSSLEPASAFFDFAQDELAHGAFGKCYRCYHKASGQKCVLKAVDKAGLSNDYLHIFLELDLFSALLAMNEYAHPNIVRYLDFFMGPTHIFPVMESLQGPELFDYYESKQNEITELFCLTTARQMLSAVERCHQSGIIHRDLKLENFRYRRADHVASELVLLDFGLACPAEPQVTRPVVGTFHYMAPEIHCGDYGTLVDAWSAGVILFVLLAGVFPFQPTRERSLLYTDDIVSTTLERCQLAAFPEAVDLVKQLLRSCPESRPGAKQALEHKWFSSSPADTDVFLPRLLAENRSKRASSTHPFKTVARQVSEIERETPGGLSRSQIRKCAALEGSLASPGRPLSIIFLDIDGVVAPSVNAGQVAFQCVEGLVALCKLCNASIVLSSSWRLVDGKVSLLDDLLQRFHNGDALYDVTPDFEAHFGAVVDDVELFKKHFVKVKGRAGLTLDIASKALDVLASREESALQTLGAAFRDKDYDLHVFSESTREYAHVSFSPRSRRGDADHGCTSKFAETRRKEVLAWLRHAAALGVQVDSWVVLDDDDLTQLFVASEKSHHSARDSSFGGYSASTGRMTQPANVPTKPAAEYVLAEVPDDLDDDPFAW